MSTRWFCSCLPVLILLLLGGCGSPPALVVYERTGGILGVTERLTLHPSGAVQVGPHCMTLPAAEVHQLTTMLMAVNIASLPSTSRAARPNADLMQHTLTFDGITVTGDDTALPSVLPPVIDRLTQIILATHGTALPCPVA